MASLGSAGRTWEEAERRESRREGELSGAKGTGRENCGQHAPAVFQFSPIAAVSARLESQVGLFIRIRPNEESNTRCQPITKIHGRTGWDTVVAGSGRLQSNSQMVACLVSFSVSILHHGITLFPSQFRCFITKLVSRLEIGCEMRVLECVFPGLMYVILQVTCGRKHHASNFRCQMQISLGNGRSSFLNSTSCQSSNLFIIGITPFISIPLVWLFLSCLSSM